MLNLAHTKEKIMNLMEKAIALFDAYNQQDPRHIEWQGVSYAFEYFYALQLYNWVRKLEPAASESLLLASRCQHIGRWKSPRENYPQGKAGYLTWRSELRHFHSDTAGALMLEAGYNEDAVREVQRIILKDHLKTDHEVQVMEDALCLVFLQFQYEDFIKNHDETKVIRILQKSWKKMSPQGREQALALDYQGTGKGLIDKALQ